MCTKQTRAYGSRHHQPHTKRCDVPWLFLPTSLVLAPTCDVGTCNLHIFFSYINGMVLNCLLNGSILIKMNIKRQVSFKPLFCFQYKQYIFVIFWIKKWLNCKVRNSALIQFEFGALNRSATTLPLPCFWFSRQDVSKFYPIPTSTPRAFYFLEKIEYRVEYIGCYGMVHSVRAASLWKIRHVTHSKPITRQNLSMGVILQDVVLYGGSF